MEKKELKKAIHKHTEDIRNVMIYSGKYIPDYMHYDGSDDLHAIATGLERKQKLSDLEEVRRLLSEAYANIQSAFELL
jgi:hypothetical protein